MKISTLSQLFTWVADEELPRRWKADHMVYICPSIMVAPCDQKLKDKARAIVDGRLDGYTYLGWIAKNHRHLLVGDVKRKAYEGRMRWCRALAEEFR